jgi:type IV secretory pathway VirB10-like protein
MRKIALFALVGALALSACGKKEEDTPVTNNLVEPPVENVIVEEPEAPLPEPQNNAVATPVAPPPSVSEQQQIQDDAEATGMTSRLPEGGEQSQPADGASTTGQ